MQPKIVLDHIAVILRLYIDEVLQLDVTVSTYLSEDGFLTLVEYFPRVSKVEEREVTVGDGSSGSWYVSPKLLVVGVHDDATFSLAIEQRGDQKGEPNCEPQQGDCATDGHSDAYLVLAIRFLRRVEILISWFLHKKLVYITPMSLWIWPGLVYALTPLGQQRLV